MHIISTTYRHTGNTCIAEGTYTGLLDVKDIFDAEANEFCWFQGKSIADFTTYTLLSETCMNRNAGSVTSLQPLGCRLIRNLICSENLWTIIKARK